VALVAKLEHPHAPRGGAAVLDPGVMAWVGAAAKPAGQAPHCGLTERGSAPARVAHLVASTHDFERQVV
jgi:hypothetical protein